MIPPYKSDNQIICTLKLPKFKKYLHPYAKPAAPSTLIQKGLGLHPKLQGLGHFVSGEGSCACRRQGHRWPQDGAYALGVGRCPDRITHFLSDHKPCLWAEIQVIPIWYEVFCYYFNCPSYISNIEKCR